MLQPYVKMFISLTLIGCDAASILQDLESSFHVSSEILDLGVVQPLVGIL